MSYDKNLSRRGFIAAAGAVAFAAGATVGTAGAASSGALGTYAGEYNQYERYDDEEGSEVTGKEMDTLNIETNCATGAYTAGTYVGEAPGIGGTITAAVTVDETSILEVILEGPSETPSIGGAALEALAPAFVEAQTNLVDAVGGATITSKGARDAVAAALKQASGIEDHEWTLDEINMNTGYYTTFVQGFSLISKMPVMVRTHAKSI